MPNLNYGSHMNETAGIGIFEIDIPNDFQPGTAALLIVKVEALDINTDSLISTSETYIVETP